VGSNRRQGTDPVRAPMQESLGRRIWWRAWEATSRAHLAQYHKDAANKLLAKLLNVSPRSCSEPWPVTFSIGAVTFLTPPESVPEMIHRADEIMYSVKQSGKNRLRQEELAA